MYLEMKPVIKDKKTYCIISLSLFLVEVSTGKGVLVSF